MSKLVSLIFVFNLVLILNTSNCHAWWFPWHVGLYRLDIIHYNDFHARFQETSVRQATCSSNDNLCLGGFARLYYEISKLREEKPHSILLNAGDSFQGTLWYTLLKWNVTQKFMNMLPHDAHAIGNHEFDDGPAGLAPYLAALNAPVVAANMDSSNEPQLNGLYEPSIIIRRKGRRIGIIGLITPETKDSSSPGGVIFTDPKAATGREAKKLALQGVDIIVVLSHCGLQMDKEIARDYGKYVDIIVGGHSHSLLWNGASPSGENVEGPYPVIVQPTADNKHNVLIVQSSAFTKYMGNLSVYFDLFGNYVKWDGGPIFLNRSIPEDAKMKAKLEPYAQIIREASNAEIGQSSVLLDHELCMSGECALGNMLVDAMNDYAKQKVISTYPFIAFMQRGNIKSTLLPGVITHGMILEMLPFQNRFISFEIKGSFIFDALEHAVMSYWQYNPYQTPWLLQVSGLKVSYDVSKPEGQRVVLITVGDQNTPLDLQATYQVTVPDYLADGGDGFSMFKNGKQNVQVLGRDDEIVVEYIKAHSPLTNEPEGRITIQF